MKIECRNEEEQPLMTWILINVIQVHDPEQHLRSFSRRSDILGNVNIGDAVTCKSYNTSLIKST